MSDSNPMNSPLENASTNLPAIFAEFLNLQVEWEILLRQVLETKKSASKILGSINLDSGELLLEELFVRPGASIPEMGIALTGESTKLQYSCKCFRGNPLQYGPIIVAEPHMETLGERRNLSLPANVAGERALQLSEKYDAIICKALANVYGEKVLNSLEVGYHDSPIKRSYLQRGYAKREDYPQVVDKIYLPQV